MYFTCFAKNALKRIRIVILRLCTLVLSFTEHVPHVFLNITKNCYEHQKISSYCLCLISNRLSYSIIFILHFYCKNKQKVHNIAKVLRARYWNTFFERQHFICLYYQVHKYGPDEDCTIYRYNELEKTMYVSRVVFIRQYAHTYVNARVCVCVYITLNSK